MDARLCRLCLVTDRPLAGERSLLDIVDAAVAGGVTMVQLREKTTASREFLEIARTLKARLVGRNVPLIINDRLDIALAAGADGVHVGQDDLPVSEVRRMLPAGAIVGLSVTHLEEALRADAEIADYLGVGPIFAQVTKLDATPPIALDGLYAIRRATRKPILAIGGIAPANAQAIRDAGADGLAVVSAIMAADDPRAAAQALAG